MGAVVVLFINQIALIRLRLVYVHYARRHHGGNGYRHGGKKPRPDVVNADFQIGTVGTNQRIDSTLGSVIGSAASKSTFEKPF